MNILVTGGAGYIGSHAVRHLVEAGHKVVALDDLSRGHRESIVSGAHFQQGSVKDSKLVKRVVNEFSVEAVMHFAAFADVGESVSDPCKYYENNFSATLELLKTLLESNVKKFVFSSTATVYGVPYEISVKEEYSGVPISPYGKSKLMVEELLADLSSSHQLSFAVLRYFNVAGAHPDASMGEDHRPESHLIPNILFSCLDREKIVSVYGDDYPTPDGTSVRDFVHVQDIVQAHMLALKNLESQSSATYNVGSDKGFSILEVIEACEKVIGKKIRFEKKVRRPGDAPSLVANSEKIRKELGWRPQYPDLVTMIEHAWAWHQQNPRGYAGKLSGI